MYNVLDNTTKDLLFVELVIVIVITIIVFILLHCFIFYFCNSTCIKTGYLGIRIVVEFFEYAYITLVQNTFLFNSSIPRNVIPRCADVYELSQTNSTCPSPTQLVLKSPTNDY